MRTAFCVLTFDLFFDFRVEDIVDEYGASPAARILMVAGGTGGHIFPALAVAEELRARGERSGSPLRDRIPGHAPPVGSETDPGGGLPASHR